MSILRAGAMSAVATAARLVSGLAVIKLVAWFAGPEGVGKFGQFMNLMTLLAVLGSGGIGMGIAKYVAEYRTDPDRLQRLLGTGARYVLFASCLVAALTALFATQLSLLLFDDAGYRDMILVLAALQPVIVAGNFALATLNGFMDARRIAIIQVTGALLAVLLTGILTYLFNLRGALVAAACGQAALILVIYPVMRRASYFDRSVFTRGFDRFIGGDLAGYSAMMLLSAALTPLVGIAVRNHLAGRFSWEDVGYWQAVSKLSEAYLAFFTGWIGVYYLPKLAAAFERTALIAELHSAYRYVLPAAIAMAVAIYVFRDGLTILVFGSEFVAAGPLYAPQLVGDVLKVASQLLAYIMMAKAMKGAFIGSELVFSATYVLLVYLLTDRFGLIGAMYAFAANYALYLIFTILMARHYVQRM